jgi:transposase
MAWSKDLRKRIYEAVQKGEMRQVEILRHYQVSRSGLNSFLQHVQETGSIERKPPSAGRKPKFNEKDIEKIKKYLETHTDATLQEIREYMKKDASIMAVSRTLEKIGYRLKKNRSSPASKKDRT